jgi:hypothetical protein
MKKGRKEVDEERKQGGEGGREGGRKLKTHFHLCHHPCLLQCYRTWSLKDRNKRETTTTKERMEE